MSARTTQLQDGIVSTTSKTDPEFYPALRTDVRTQFTFEDEPPIRSAISKRHALVKSA